MVEGVIFDLDGVIVSTDDYHYKAWKKLATRLDIPFDEKKNNRLRGVSRMESLDILLEESSIKYSDEEKKKLAEEKNSEYLQFLKELSSDHVLAGVEDTLKGLRALSVKQAIGSSSKNAQRILKQIGLFHAFDAIADGTMIARSKPDPEVFLLAAEKLGVAPKNCLVVEDAASGVVAAKNAGMKVLGVGGASEMDELDFGADDLSKVDLPKEVRNLNNNS